jgi:transglutaminase-like putative cysteine protease
MNSYEHTQKKMPGKASQLLIGEDGGRKGDPTSPTLQDYFNPSLCVDSAHPVVAAYAQKHSQGSNAREKAVSLYYAVRDGFRYDPYRVDISPQGLSASAVLARGYGHCISKAVLLAATARACGIGARLGFADVKNHLTSPQLHALLQTDIFYWHGYAELLLDGQWVKATPAFNIELCQKAGVRPLDFDGVHDSLYHEYDISGQKHMEYLNKRGHYVDVPVKEIMSTYLKEYPHAAKMQAPKGNFADEVRR